MWRPSAIVLLAGLAGCGGGDEAGYDVNSADSMAMPVPAVDAGYPAQGTTTATGSTTFDSVGAPDSDKLPTRPRPPQADDSATESLP